MYKVPIIDGAIQAIKFPNPNPATIKAVMEAINAPTIFPICVISQLFFVVVKFLKKIKSLTVINNPKPPKKTNKTPFVTALTTLYIPIKIMIIDENNIVPEINLSVKSACVFDFNLKVNARFPDVTR